MKVRIHARFDSAALIYGLRYRELQTGWCDDAGQGTRALIKSGEKGSKVTAGCIVCIRRSCEIRCEPKSVIQVPVNGQRLAIIVVRYRKATANYGLAIVAEQGMQEPAGVVRRPGHGDARLEV